MSPPSFLATQAWGLYGTVSARASRDSANEELSKDMQTTAIDLLNVLESGPNKDINRYWVMYKVVSASAEEVFGISNAPFDREEHYEARKPGDRCDIESALSQLRQKPLEHGVIMDILSGEGLKRSRKLNIPPALMSQSAKSSPAPAPSSAPAPLRAPVSSAPVSSAPVSSAPVSSAPVSSAPVSSAPVSSAPVSSVPEQFKSVSGGEMRQTFSMPDNVSYETYIRPFYLKLQKELNVTILGHGEKITFTTFIYRSRGSEAAPLALEAEWHFVRACQIFVAWRKECDKTPTVPDFALFVHRAIFGQVTQGWQQVVADCQERENARQASNMSQQRRARPPAISRSHPYYSGPDKPFLTGAEQDRRAPVQMSDLRATKAADVAREIKREPDYQDVIREPKRRRRGN